MLKQVAELSHKTKDQQCFYDNLNGKKKLVNINSQELFIPSVFAMIYDTVEQNYSHFLAAILRNGREHKMSI